MSTTLVPPDTATVPGDAPAPSGSAALRRMMLRLHFYVGLLVGPFLLVAALSGVGYALSPTLERIVNHDQLVAASPAVDTPLDRQLDTARAVRGTGHTGHQIEREPGECVTCAARSGGQGRLCAPPGTCHRGG